MISSFCHLNHLNDQGDPLAARAYAAIIQRINSLADTCARVMKVEIVSTEAVPHPKRQSFCIRVVFHFTLKPGDTPEVRRKGSEKKQNQLAQNASNEVLQALAARVVDDINLVENAGAMGIAIIDQKLVSKEDFFARYQITVPLSSTAKAAKIIIEMWANGGLFVSALSPTDSKRMQTPVVCAWVTNFSFPELLQMNDKSPLKDVLLWVLECVTASTEFNPIGQVVHSSCLKNQETRQIYVPGNHGILGV